MSLSSRRCVPCTASNQPCDKRKPICNLCKSSGFLCSWFEKKPMSLTAKKFIHMNPSSIPGFKMDTSGWEAVVRKASSSEIVRFYIKRTMQPLAVAFPEVIVNDAVLKRAIGLTVSYIRQVEVSKRAPSGIPASHEERRMLVEQAIDAFFQFINPFLPLFSKKGFHSKPRSALLKAIMTKLGLQCLPPSKLASEIEAQIDEKFTPKLLFSLPPSLNTLQCLVLIIYATVHPKLAARLSMLYNYANVVMLALGHHVNPKHDWLERRLAFDAFHLGSFFTSHGQIVTELKARHSDYAVLHFLDPFETRRPALTRSLVTLEDDDRIHFITSQFLYYASFLVTSAYKLQSFSKRNPVPSRSVLSQISTSVFNIRAAFGWAWEHLGSLQPSQTHHQSKFMVLLYYHGYCDCLAEIASYANLASPLLDRPNNDSSSTHGRLGLYSAVSLIHLFSLLRPDHFQINYARLMVSACIFIAANFKSVDPASQNLLAASYEKACSGLRRIPRTSKFISEVLPNLELLKMLANHLGILLK